MLDWNVADVSRFISNIDVGDSDSCCKWKLVPTIYGYGQFKLRDKIWRTV